MASKHCETVPLKQGSTDENKKKKTKFFGKMSHLPQNVGDIQKLYVSNDPKTQP